MTLCLRDYFDFHETQNHTGNSNYKNVDLPICLRILAQVFRGSHFSAKIGAHFGGATSMYQNAVQQTIMISQTWVTSRDHTPSTLISHPHFTPDRRPKQGTLLNHRSHDRVCINHHGGILTVFALTLLPRHNWLEQLDNHHYRIGKFNIDNGNMCNLAKTPICMAKLM